MSEGGIIKSSGQNLKDALNSNRHIIFLGAGASASSGYPTGDNLRFRLCLKKRFTHDMWEVNEQLRGENNYGQRVVDEYWRKLYEEFGHSIHAFREGLFETVDAFSRHVSDNPSRQQDVQNMKILIRFALALHNPELNHDNSDYVAFIPKLFREDKPHLLKDNITVLSYNYDIYFDYLLYKAQKQRLALAGIADEPKNFYDKGFQLLKLHGSVAEDLTLYGSKFFEEEAKPRLDFLLDGNHMTSPPPIVFPWELFDAEGAFIKENDFIFVKALKGTRTHLINS